MLKVVIDTNSLIQMLGAKSPYHFLFTKFLSDEFTLCVSRNSPEDLSQRMLNAMEPGTIMPIHRHHASSETVVMLRGKIRWIFFDDEGNETERVLLDADSDVRSLTVERDRWHSLECLESGSVLFECKDGAYHPLEEDEILVID